MTILIIFAGVGTIGITVVRWRINYDGYADKGFLHALVQETQHIPTIALFWNSVPFHLTTVCFRYFLGLKIKFGATAKEKDTTITCMGHLLTTVRRYYSMYLAMFIFTLAFGGLLYMQPEFTTNVFVVVPIAVFIVGHVLGPYVLDPDIMRLLY
jgi:hypothetical protein